MTATIPGWLPEQMANGSHGHWSQRQKKLTQAANMAYWHAKQAGWTPLTTRARLDIVLVFPQRRHRDHDNLVSRCKGLIDGIKPFVVDDCTDWLDLHVSARVEAGCRAVVMELRATSDNEGTA